MNSFLDKPKEVGDNKNENCYNKNVFGFVPSPFLFKFHSAVLNFFLIIIHTLSPCIILYKVDAYFQSVLRFS